jgi:Bacterial regulatory proteins, luxR family
MRAARGLTNRDVAARLCLPVRTVEVHIDHILTKLGFRARTRLAAWAHGEGPPAGQGNTWCLRISSDDLPGRRGGTLAA